MALIECLAWGRQITREAEACPQCGHPIAHVLQLRRSPNCYACQATATTTCQSCGTLRPDKPQCALDHCVSPAQHFVNLRQFASSLLRGC